MQKKTLFLILFIALKMVLQFVVVNPIYELHRDEYLHLDQAHHLAWGFHSVPPLTSFFSYIIFQLGNSYFWIKFFPALFGALTIMMVWKTVNLLKGNLFACSLAAIALIFSPFLRINLLYQPNSFDVLSWTLVYYFLVRFVKENNYKWLYLAAVGFALGFLNKYNIIFCAVGLLPALLLSPLRRHLAKPQFYLALLLALLLISPNLIWQFQHNFPVFRHLKELNETQLVHVSRLDFLAEQFKFFLGSLIILVAAFIGFFNYRPFRPYRILALAYLFTLLVFVALRAKGYYALGLYPILIAFGSCYLGILTEKKRALRYVLMAIVLLLFVPVAWIALPLKTPGQYVRDAAAHRPFSEHRWEDGKYYPISQDFADMLGWEELAYKVDAAYRLQKDRSNLLVLCDNYGQAGAINYFTKNEGLIANSFNADYANWIDLSKPIHTVIWVMEAGSDSEKVNALFADVTVLGEVDYPYAREKGTKIMLLKAPRTDINALLKREQAKMAD
ncbi:MAG: glycosyltransferase family 39 protein [Pedobacter sp.]|nr:glycosyltransferase family 39 protein [Pedobacter sp.]MDQ8053497.1 glycosyltransferase family 39 protein [Pedobacter sp.]